MKKGVANFCLGNHDQNFHYGKLYQKQKVTRNKKCGDKNVINHFIYLVKRNFHLTRIIRQINDLLSE